MKNLESIENFNNYAIDDHMQKSIVGMGSCTESRCPTDDCDHLVTVTRDDDSGNSMGGFQYIEICSEVA